MTPIPRHEIAAILQRALVEDLALAGDLTTNALVPADHQSEGRIVAREQGTIAGLDIGLGVFELIGGTVMAECHVQDGQRVSAGTVLATVKGSSRTILSGERTCLNLLGHLSGIATSTASVVDRLAGSGTRVADTRKTTPGLRSLEKYAVRCGGGINHRFGLHDAVMIKDNHLALANSIGEAISAARRAIGHTVSITVEVDRLDQIEEAIEAGADIVLIDNLRGDELRRAVEIVGGRAVTEASGGITPDLAAEIAAAGVDIISLGWITHSAPRLDVALDF